MCCIGNERMGTISVSSEIGIVIKEKSTHVSICFDSSQKNSFFFCSSCMHPSKNDFGSQKFIDKVFVDITIEKNEQNRLKQYCGTFIRSYHGWTINETSINRIIHFLNLV